MANSCFTFMTFSGNKNEISDLHSHLNQLFDLAEKNPSILESTGKYGTDDTALENVLIVFGHEKLVNDIYNPKVETSISCRGNIIEIDEEIEQLNDTTWYFGIQVDNAWTPITKIWDFIIENHYKTVSYVLEAEEAAHSVYINTDTEGTFYRTRVCVYAYIKGTDFDFNRYYEDLEGIVEDIIDELKHHNIETPSGVTTLDQLKDWFACATKGQFNIYEYETTIGQDEER